MTRFDPESSVICKGCKHMIEFSDLLRTYNNPIRFPKGDLSALEVYCPTERTSYLYESNEVLVPVREESDLARRVESLEKQLANIEGRLSVYANSLDEKKQELEKFVVALISQPNASTTKGETKKPLVAYG